MRWLGPLLLCVACGPAGPPDEAALPLLTSVGWVEVAAADDPFNDRPDEVRCDPAGYGPEGAAFEVLTDVCAYGTFSQPAGHDVPAGATLSVEMWHLNLTAASPARGHFAVAAGGEVAEVQPEIPGDPAAYTLELHLKEGIQAGDPLFLHVHNHGSNSWYLGDWTVTSEDP